MHSLVPRLYSTAFFSPVKKSLLPAFRTASDKSWPGVEAWNKYVKLKVHNGFC